MICHNIPPQKYTDQIIVQHYKIAKENKVVQFTEI